ncbi:MAG TPA: type II secretion system F family protein [Candidatus Baltobacteraceae bacterium]
MNVDVFRYTARSREGEVVAGVLRAESLRAATVDLQRRALFVTSLTAGSEKRRVRFPEIAGRRRREVLAVFRALSVLVRAGVPLRRALEVSVAHCGQRRLREALRAVVADVEHGSTLSAAFARRPTDFSRLQTAMIGAGEAGGVLDDVLDRIADVLEREHTVRKRLQAALVYPCVVAGAAMLLIFFLMVHVVPMFASLFERFSVPLPWPTRVLLDLGGVLRSANAMTIIPLAIGCIATLVKFFKPARDESLDRVKLRAPLIGVVFRHAVVARIARMLGALLRSGVGVLTAIDVVGPVSGSSTYQRALSQVSDSLRRGEGMHRALQETALFDPLTLALVGVGEESGSLDSMLLAAANYLDVEVEAAITALVSVLEPALIGAVGVVVAFIVFSIFLPLYGLIGSIT